MRVDCNFEPGLMGSIEVNLSDNESGQSGGDGAVRASETNHRGTRSGRPAVLFPKKNDPIAL